MSRGLHLRRIARRWLPEHATGWPGRAAIALNLLAAIAAPVALALAPSPAGTGRPVIIAALALAAVFAAAAEVRLKQSEVAFFDPSIVLALLAVAVAGPWVALAIWVIPLAISVGVRRRVPPLSPGVVATATGYCFGVAGAGAVLSLGAGQPLLAQAALLYAAGVTMWASSFLFTAVLFAPAYEGFSVASLVRTELLPLSPALLGMLALASLSWLLIGPLGALALAPLTAAVLLPQVAMTAARETRSIARLDQADATRVYAAALAEVLDLDPRDRRALAIAARLPAAPPPSTPTSLSRELADWVAVLGASLRHEESIDTSEARLFALRANERFDAHRWPSGAGGLSPIPLPSRVLACARVWTELTVGPVGLPHPRALRALRARAGGALDPAVVDAAETVVAREATLANGSDFEPRLHRLPLPRPLRRGAVAALLTAAAHAS